MKRSGLVVALVSVALLVVAAAAPASARLPVGEASGDVTWNGEKDSPEDASGRTTLFRVRDGTPGMDLSRGDRGFLFFSQYNDVNRGSFRMRVKCVRIDGNVAEFSGKVTRATGNYANDPKAGNTFVMRVVDGGQPGTQEDGIGMRAYGPKDGLSGLERACAEVLSSSQIAIEGDITGGDIRVHDPR